MTQTESTQPVALTDLAGSFTIDAAHSRLGFVARHAMVTKVRGEFDEFEGTVHTGAGPTGTQIDVVAQTASISTRNEDRDGHLRTGDFLSVDEHPTLNFRSTDVTATDAETLLVVGDLTIKGITQTLTFDVEYGGAATDPFGNKRVGFEGSTTILRSDFGISFNAALETGGVLVSDKITLEFEISAIQDA